MVIKVNNTDLKIISLFTKGYNKEYYIREVEKILMISSRTAFVTLAKLEKIGILRSEIKGKIKIYFIRRSIISREYFLLTEQYKKIQFLDNNHLIKEIFEKLEKYIEGIIILFGSYAKGTQKNDSDLDLFIVGRYNLRKIKEIGDKYGIEINVKSYPITIFYKKINNDILLREIIENHVVIKNAEQFVGSVILWIK